MSEQSYDVRIERATESALAACFAMLPMLASPNAVIFTARDADGTLAGAGGLVWQSWGNPPGFPAWIHVLPDRRRRGIAHALAAAIEDAATGEEMRGIWAVRPLDQGSEAEAFATACGMQPVRRQLHFETDAPAFLVLMEEIVGRLRARGRIPSEARLMDIDTAKPGEIERLVQIGIRTAPPQMALLLQRARTEDPTKAPVDRDRSCLLMMGDEVAGVLLSRRQKDGVNSAIVCNVVAPEWRGGWANAMLLEGTTRRGVGQGCRRFAFDCAEDVRDTIGLARRSGADRVRTAVLYRYAAAATPA